MNFDSLKDQLRDQFNALWSQIQNSSAYNTFKERFEALPNHVQKWVVIGASVVGVLFVLSIPWSYISSSSVMLEEFEENRNLIRELLKAARTLKEAPALPPGLDATQLQSRAENVVRGFTLIEEQVAGIQPLNDRPAGNLAPPAVQQQGVAVNLKTLNLWQVLDIGHRLSTLDPSVRMMGIEMIQSAAKANYFDVTYKLVSFSMPQPKVDENERPEPPRGRRSPPSESGDEAAGTEDNP